MRLCTLFARRHKAKDFTSKNMKFFLGVTAPEDKKLLFNSYIFVFLFLPLCLLLYFGSNHFHKYELGKIFLTCMSLWFYAYFNVNYLPIILCSIPVNYFLYCLLERTAHRKAVVATGILLNLGVLFYFKYYDFFIGNINSLFGTNFLLNHVLLPLGISFFTFQQIGFLVDAYRGEAKGYSFLDYALFVTFFPQLIAGPIVTHKEMIPQFQELSKKKFDWDNFGTGVYGFVLGMTKKVLVADTFGLGVDWGFANPERLNGLAVLLVMLSYMIQLYFDFSGYCDMARGIGKMFNIEIPVNFNSPYKAVDLIDFWKRWHITLSRFFTQYVYIPLGGSRKGTVRTYFNIFMIYFVSGVWHGAGWTYVIWGAMHASVYVLTRIFKKGIEKIPKVITWFGTMVFFMFSLVFFRAESVSQALLLLKRLFTEGFDLPWVPADLAACYQLEEFWYPLKVLGVDRLPFAQYYMMFLLIGGAWFVMLLCKNVNEKMENRKQGVLNAVICAGLLIWNVISFSGVSSFLYFNF